MIITTVRIAVSPEKRQMVVDLIRPIIEPTLVQSGCLSCRFYQDVTDANSLTYEEVWHSQEMLDRHICSESYEHILAAIDLARQEPEIHFNTIFRSDGFEMIFGARHVEQPDCSDDSET